MAGRPEEHLSHRIHQASGMVAAQVGCDIDEALARLRVRATAIGRTLEDIAVDVLDRRVRFDD